MQQGRPAPTMIIYIYIYTHIHIYYIIVKKLIISTENKIFVRASTICFQNVIASLTKNEFAREDQYLPSWRWFSRWEYNFSQKSIYLLRKSKVCFSFENMNVSKKFNSLLREYDLFIQEYAKTTTTWDEIQHFECFWGKQLKQKFPQRGALTVRFWGRGRDPGEGRFV